MKPLLAGVTADHLLTPFFRHSALAVYLHHLRLPCHSLDHSLLGWKVLQATRNVSPHQTYIIVEHLWFLLIDDSIYLASKTCSTVLTVNQWLTPECNTCTMSPSGAASAPGLGFAAHSHLTLYQQLCCMSVLVAEPFPCKEVIVSSYYYLQGLLAMENVWLMPACWPNIPSRHLVFGHH